MTGHPEYKRILDEMWDLHCRKASSYGSDEDSLANLRNGERFGMPAWKRCLVESDSAFYRLENYCNGRNPSYESAENALMDAAAFSLLALLFLREERHQQYAEVADAEFEAMLSVGGVTAEPTPSLLEFQKLQQKITTGYREPSEEIGNRMLETLEKAKWNGTASRSDPAGYREPSEEIGNKMTETLEKAK